MSGLPNSEPAGPRMRLATLMLGLAAFALVFAAQAAAARRARRFEARAHALSRSANAWEQKLIGPSGTSRDGPSGPEADRILKRVNHFDNLVNAYTKAAAEPWLAREPADATPE